MRFGPKSTPATIANVIAVHSQPGDGWFGPKINAFSADPETRAHPGKNHPKKLNPMNAMLNPRHIRANPMYALSPVQIAHRPISKFIQSCTKTPSTAAHAMDAPYCAV